MPTVEKPKRLATVVNGPLPSFSGCRGLATARCQPLATGKAWQRVVSGGQARCQAVAKLFRLTGSLTTRCQALAVASDCQLPGKYRFGLCFPTFPATCPSRVTSRVPREFRRQPKSLRAPEVTSNANDVIPKFGSEKVSIWALFCKLFCDLALTDLFKVTSQALPREPEALRWPEVTSKVTEVIQGSEKHRFGLCFSSLSRPGPQGSL